MGSSDCDQLTALMVSDLPALQVSTWARWAWGLRRGACCLNISISVAHRNLALPQEFTFTQCAHSTFAQLSMSGLPNLARVHISLDTLPMLPALPGVSRLELTQAGNASELSPAHMDALARLPRLVCMAYWPPCDTERAAALAQQLQERLPHLTIEAESC